MATTVIYKKDLDQKQTGNETNLIINPLKKLIPKAASGRSRGIKLPKYIVFKIDEVTKTLFLYIQEQDAIQDGKAIKLNATTCNMQTDNAAFEGWAICLKSWLPDLVEKVVLGWDMPTVEKENAHYYRFLYRVLRFTQQYSWFSVLPMNAARVAEFESQYNNLSINFSNSDPDKKEDSPENAVEYEFVKTPFLSAKIKHHYDLLNLDHQLHVGVKSHNKQLFTGGQSAIDLWGLNNRVLTIIELKYSHKKTPNTKVGIISELFLYACIMRDLIGGIIPVPHNAKLEHERELFAKIGTVEIIKAEMLADAYHPMIENDKVFDTLNNNSTKEEGATIVYGRTIYSYDRKKLTI
ncbi:MAG: hypothetical protein MJY89_01910 [Bacteroidales bacterium]|nr:hypothetical protein [Bacteroidales bacterium]